MKKTGIILAAVAMLGIACSKQQDIVDTPAKVDTPAGMKKIELKVSIDPETKAVMDGKVVKFAENDIISILVTSGETTTICPMTVTSVDEGVLTFSAEVSEDATIGEYAYYPSDLIIPNGENPINPLQISWPNRYFANQGVALPMMAKIDTENNEAVFKHLGAILKVNLVNLPTNDGGLEFKTSQNFVCDYTVNPSDWSITPITGNYDLNYEIVGTTGDGVYYIPIPAGSYADFQLGMTSAMSAINPFYYKQRTANLSSPIAPTRGQIVNLGDFEYDVDEIAEWYLICQANGWNYADQSIRMIKTGENTFIAATWNGKWNSDDNDTRGFKIAGSNPSTWGDVYGNNTQYQATGSLVQGGKYNGHWTNDNELYSTSLNSFDMSYTTTNEGNGDGYKYTDLALNWDGDDVTLTMTALGTHHWKGSLTVDENRQYNFFIKDPNGWPRCSNVAYVSDSAPYCAVGGWVEDATGNKCKATLTPGNYDVYYNDIKGNIMFVRTF